MRRCLWGYGDRHIPDEDEDEDETKIKPSP